MKKYTVINNETGKEYNYSRLSWDLAWVLVFIFGMITGACLF